MKNLKYILGTAVLSLAMASCSNYFDDKQIKNDYKVTEVRTMEYTLTSNDYSTVTTIASNKATALSLCTAEDSSAYTQFLQIAKDKAFNELATADTYVPALIHQLFPMLDNGSICNVTYNLVQGTPAYLSELNLTQDYTLTAADYATIWGKEGIAYLTPSTVGKLTTVLPDKGDTVLNVIYEYSANEPKSEEEDPEPQPTRTWMTPQEVADAYAAGTIESGVTQIEVKGVISRFYTTTARFNASYGNIDFYVTYPGSDVEFEFYRSFSVGDQKWLTFEIVGTDSVATDALGNTIQVGDTVIGSGTYKYYTDKDIHEFSGSQYLTQIIHPVAKAPRRAAALAEGTNSALYQNKKAYKNDKVKATVIMSAEASDAVRFLQVTYPYAVADDKYVVLVKQKNAYVATEYVFDGANFIENTGIVSETMSFALNTAWLANLSTYYKQAIMGEGQGNLAIQDVKLTGGITYVWVYAASYGMKGTSYANKQANAAESWVVTPAIRLKNSKKPALQFDQAINYGPATLSDREKEMSVLVSTDYAGDVTAANWTELKHNAFDAEKGIGFPDSDSWTFYNSGDMDLSAWNNQTIYIAFRYNSDFNDAEGNQITCATWEFKNLLVYETETAE